MSRTDAAPQCPRCGAENLPDSLFCTECGARIEAGCAACGAANPPGARFCHRCGERLEGAPAGDSTAPQPSPLDYTPKHLAEKILHGKSALEGERKHVTVFFADVKGSMDLAGQVDPEEWHRILNRFFEILTDGVHRFEGTVNQYTGDGIMALFGAPIAHEDHAQRACYAALHLSEELRRYGNDLRLSKGLNFAVRMGLNSGEVIVGKIGDDLRMDYTAQGQTVGLAARMEQIAEPGKIFLAENTGKLVAGFFDLEDLGEVRVPGIRSPAHVSELRGAGEARTRFDVSRARGLSRFVGRDDDMNTLDAALAHAREGNGQVVGVVGEAGVGKSRLCYEFVERCRRSGLTVLEGRAAAHGKNVPLLPMLQVFRAYYGIAEGDSDRAAREKIAGRLLLIDESFREVLPLLFEFFGVPDPQRQAPRMDPEARQQQLFGVLRRMIQAGETESPNVALIEDLHWIDGASEAFLEQWVEAVAGTRSLLLVNFRPEYHAGWMQKSYYHQLPLLPLGAEAVRDLLEDLLGTDPSLGDLVEVIHQRTAGNPFFTEEVVQSLIEAGSLEGARGRFRLTMQVESLLVPSTVQSVLASRIDRLAEREKHLLHTAAVIGKEFSEPVLEEVVELPRADLVDGLSLLKSAEFIYEQALYPVVEYAFKHPLTQEVAYGSQLQERRRGIHAAVARATEVVHPDRVEEQAALIAYHREEAGEELEAARWHLRAAEWAGFANPVEALQHWKKVRSLPKDLPESAETLLLRVTACSQILNLAWRVGMSEEEASTVFADGRALAERSPDLRLLAAVLTFYAPVRGVVLGDVRGWAEYGEAAMVVASEIGDLGLQSAASLAVQCSLGFLGRLRDSVKVSNRMLRNPSLPELDPQSDPWGLSSYGWTLGWRGFMWAALGRPADGATELEKAIELARQRDETENLVYTLNWRVYVAEYAGDSDSALRSAQQAVEAAEKIGLPWYRVLAYAGLGRARALLREWREAFSAFEVSAANIRQGRLGLAEEPLLLAYLADAISHLGDHERAATTAEKAVALARERSVVLFEMPALVMLSRVLLRCEIAEARSRTREALTRVLDLVDETGARAFEPWVHEESAELARLIGDEVQRERELREAHRLYTEMGATGHAQRLAKELGM